MIATSSSGSRSAAGILERVRAGVVIPAYRARETVAAVLAGLPSEVQDVFVVDDASPDATGDHVLALAHRGVRLIRHDRNLGVGGAVKTGYRAALEAGCDVIVKMDADGQMDPAFLPDLVRPLLTGEAGYAKGNRLWSLTASRSMPRRRLLGNLFLSMATKAVSGYWNTGRPQHLAQRQGRADRVRAERRAALLLQLGHRRPGHRRVLGGKERVQLAGHAAEPALTGGARNIE